MVRIHEIEQLMRLTPSIRHMRRFFSTASHSRPSPAVFEQLRALERRNSRNCFSTQTKTTVSVLPPTPHGDVLWYGPDMARRRAEWVHVLRPEEIDELRSATERVIAADQEITQLTSQDFPLPLLGPKLRNILQELHHGRGFALLKGLPVSQWSRREQATAFIGLGCHLGKARSQNAKGHILGHVTDLGLSSADPRVRIYQTCERQTFHTDSCDVVGLLCLQPAQRGGLSALVSTATLYAEMKRRRPDLALQLFQPVATDRRGEVPPGAKPYFLIPVLSSHDGFLTGIYQRQYIDSAQRFPDAPRLSPDMVAALDLWDALSDDAEIHLQMQLEPGDVQLVHNHSLLHDRTAFEDSPAPARRRHLLRLWLATEGARPLPRVFGERFGSTRVGDRGGVQVSEHAPLVAPLEPE